MITPSEKSTFTTAVDQWSSLSRSEQRTTLNCLIERVRQVLSDRELKIPDAGFLEFTARAGLHNFQMQVAAGIEKDTAENRDLFCTDFILKFVTQPERSYF